MRIPFLVLLILLVQVTLVQVTLAPVTPVLGETYTLYVDGSGDFPTIQEPLTQP